MEGFIMKHTESSLKTKKALPSSLKKDMAKKPASNGYGLFSVIIKQ